MDAIHAELKKGSMEMLVLSLLDDRPLHGYEIARQYRDAVGRPPHVLPSPPSTRRSSASRAGA